MPHEIGHLLATGILMIGGVTCYISGMALVYPAIEEKLYGLIMLGLTVLLIGLGVKMM